MSSKAVRRTRTNLTTYVSGKCQSEGVDRGDLRVDVLGQDRGADPPPAPRPVRQPAGGDFQTLRRYALLRRGGGVARCPRHPVDAGRIGSEYPAADLRRRRGGDRRSAVLRRGDRRRVPGVGRQRRAGDRRGTGYGLYGQTVRSDAGAHGHGGVRHEGARDLRAVRQSGAPFAPPDGRRKAGDAGRAGFLRTDLPPLLRPASRRECDGRPLFRECITAL